MIDSATAITKLRRSLKLCGRLRDRDRLHSNLTVVDRGVTQVEVALQDRVNSSKVASSEVLINTEASYSNDCD